MRERERESDRHRKMKVVWGEMVVVYVRYSGAAAAESRRRVLVLRMGQLTIIIT